MMNLKKLTPSGGRKAFTLVEILIVIIVIGILAGLMLVNANAAIETSKRAVCVADRRTIKSAWHYQDAMHRGQFQSNIAAAMADFPKAQPVSVTSTDAVYTGICQDGGAYTIKPDDNRITIECSIAAHNDKQQTSDSKTVYEAIKDILAKWPSGNVDGAALYAEVKKMLGDNDKYNFDGIDFTIKTDNKFDRSFILFASDAGYEGGDRLKANYVYDPIADTWYKCQPAVYGYNFSSSFSPIYDAMNSAVDGVGQMTLGDKTYTLTATPDFNPF